MSIKEAVRKMKGTKKRTCATKGCGASFRYSGKGRPFKRCPKCRKET